MLFLQGSSSDMNVTVVTIRLIDSSLGESVSMGGPGSGHWGHRGRKGKRGGSQKGKKLPPTDSTFTEVQLYEKIFTKGQLTRIRKEVSILPQEHLDMVNAIDHADIGEGYAAECNLYNSITMGQDRQGRAQWRAGDLTHEIGHAVSNHKKRYGIIGDPDKPDRVFYRFHTKLAREAGFKGSLALQNHYREKGLQSKFYRGFPSRYAMSHPAELFAESYMMYVRSPTTLSKRNPNIYNYIRDSIFDGVEYTK